MWSWFVPVSVSARLHACAPRVRVHADEQAHRRTGQKRIRARVHIYACSTHVYTHVDTCVYTRADTRLCTHARTHACTHVYTHEHISPERHLSTLVPFCHFDFSLPRKVSLFFYHGGFTHTFRMFTHEVGSRISTAVESTSTTRTQGCLTSCATLYGGFGPAPKLY